MPQSTEGGAGEIRERRKYKGIQHQEKAWGRGPDPISRRKRTVGEKRTQRGGCFSKGQAAGAFRKRSRAAKTKKEMESPGMVAAVVRRGGWAFRGERMTMSMGSVGF
jgi:hypothetical protein